ncbi:MAG: membrane protein insertase YidC [Hyphomonadaceae bacterium]
MVTGGPQGSDNRNMIIAVVLSMVVLIGFEFFVSRPQREREAAERRIEAVQRAEEAAQPTLQDRERVLAQSAAQRVRIETEDVDGSIALAGGRIDDLQLRDYRRTIARDSPEVTLLVPRDATVEAHEGPAGHDAFFGWEARDAAAPIADASSQWTAQEGVQLTRETPVTLQLQTPDGLEITRTISIDDNYMFTIEDRVRNTAAGPRDLRPYGVVRRQNLPPDFINNGIVHQGMTGVFGPDDRLHETRFQKAQEHARDKDRGRAGADERIDELQGQGGWLGITDHYWLTALVPDQNEQVSAWYDSRNEQGFTDYRAAYRGAWRTIAPGQEITYTQRLFAGAKRVDILRDYQRNLSIPDFDKAVDWGMFFFLTRPFFDWFLHPLGTLVGNFGLGILLTTICMKILLFPLVYQSNVMMTKMRKLQPRMKEIQDRYAEDKPRLQQEMIKLYQVEKVNPVAGCLPILVQIPIFYALYKTLTVTLEMRHAPFFGWIQDLSARDPSNLFNLFGLLPAIGIPFHPEQWPVIGTFIWLGAWPIMYGISMWALQALSPPPTDPTQAMVFRFLPLLFTFMFAGFAAGLVIYWTWSNVLSILQQYIIMRRMGVETEFDKFIAKRFGRKAAASVVE